MPDSPLEPVQLLKVKIWLLLLGFKEIGKLLARLAKGLLIVSPCAIRLSKRPAFKYAGLSNSPKLSSGFSGLT